MNKSPCLNCEDRSILCHDSCNKYKSYRDKADRVKKARRKELDADGYVVNNIYKFKKARNLPK